MLLDHDTAQFVAIRDRIAAELIDGSIDCVAGDAMEGFNPVHDVCRALIDGAINVVRERTRRDLVNLEFSVDPLTDAPIAATPLIVPLDEEAIERKIAAALDYPEMRGEVQQLLERFGRNAFAEERLRESHTPEMLERFASTPPKYEEYGAMRVGEGRYSEVIRFAEHVLPVAIAVGAATARCAS
jgi:hypothetical protein